MNDVYAAWAVREVALLTLIGFLCWLFKGWWPIFLIVFSSSLEIKNGKG
jgi:hypothetical protein